MRHCDIIKILLKGAVAGLVTTAAVIGAEGLGMSTANAFSSMPPDPDQCLDKLEHQRIVGNLTTLWSLLAFVPGFFFGALYFLSKQVNVCNPSASQYESIDDEDEDSVSAFCNSLFDAEDPLLRRAKIFLSALVLSLTALGCIYGPVRLAVNDLDRSIFTSEKCHEDFRSQTIFDLIECVMIFGIAFGALLCACCSRSSRLQTQSSPAQLEAGRASASLPPPAATAKAPGWPPVMGYSAGPSAAAAEQPTTADDSGPARGVPGQDTSDIYKL